MDEPNATPPNRERHLMRKLRPLWWWLVLVFVLFLIHEHLLWLDRTRLVFTMSLEGQPLTFDATATVGGQEKASGDRIFLGSHTFAVVHPKVEPFSTNLFIWYGMHNLGDINLKRAKGTLSVKADPPATRITIRGPDFTVTVTNSAGTTLTVPTDRYRIEAEYMHWRETGEADVTMNAQASWIFAPRLGTAQLTCNRTGASFQVLKPDNTLVEGGEFPFIIRDLPEGSYKLVAWHRENRREEWLMVKAGVTNTAEVQFRYGAVVLETEPPGASVASEDGREWGNTPLMFVELTPGQRQYQLRLSGYSPVTAIMDITADLTNHFHTNLFSINYIQAMGSARQYLASADYERALSAVSEALQANPSDSDATALRNEVLGKRAVHQAESLAKQGDYIGADKQLESALLLLPENGEVEQLLADFKKREPEQIERLRTEREERPRKVFDSLLVKRKDAALFDAHELKTSKPVFEAQSAIIDSLSNVQPVFHVTRSEPPAPETFRIFASQEFTGGMRQCLIVGGRVNDDETQILFKVLEFKSHHSVTFTGGLTFNTDYVPVHPSRIPEFTDKLKAQVEEGTTIVTERIRQAVGQAPQP